MTNVALRFDQLEARHKIDPAQLTTCANAARVRLDCHHQPPATFSVSSDQQTSSYEVDWIPATEQLRRSYRNADDAKRDGAYVLAFAVVEELEGLVSIARAETETGADYILAPTEDTEFMEDAVRLEVSGTDGNMTEARRRLKEKKSQALRGRSDLPAIAAVVGFREKVVLVGWASQ